MSERQIEYIPCETCGKLIESDDICFVCHYADKKDEKSKDFQKCENSDQTEDENFPHSS